jgi:glycosyltransferase involved in cell wall biosynthesis
MTTRRLLTIAHSYCVALNRRLAHEMARVGGESWEVAAVAPAFFYGDLRPIDLEPYPSERNALKPVTAHFTKRLHVFFYGARLRSVLREGWDLVHCWEEPYVVAGGQVAWWTPRRTPLVYWTGQNLAKRYPPPFSQIERYCVARCAGWIARGELGVRALLARGYDAKPHRAIPLGIDVESFQPDRTAGRATRERLGWSDCGPPVVGFLGRFIEAKGLALMLRTLDSTASPWRALFVGGGPMEPALRQWAVPHAGRVRIVTGVGHDGVPAYLNAMDVLLAPSQTTLHWREVLGRMLIEAFACGVPVLASDSGEIPYVVADAGVIAGEHDEAGWRRALADLLESPARRAELASRGCDRAHALYSWPVVARRHLEFFTELLSA